MADKLVISLVVLFLSCLIPYLWQYYRSHYLHDEYIFDDMTTPESLALHSEEFEQPSIIMVTQGIYVAIGYALANSILIEAPEGNIVVDTTEALSSGRLIREAFRNVSDRPIKAIIFTHNHPDHTFGAQSFVDDPDNPPEIWAHHTLNKQLQRITVTGPLIFRRSMRQFGRFLQPPAHVNSGIGPRLKFDEDDSHGLLYPNRLLEKPEEDVIIAGLPLRLVHIPGETADQMGVWLEDRQTFLCGDNVYRAFPNLYAIRGTPARDVMHWVTSLDRILELNPKHLVPSHTKPISGREEIRDVVTHYHDGIQYVHDQTVRWMNKGEMPEDIARKVQLPEQLRKHPYLQEFYGTVPWSVRGVFDSYMGWFSGDVTELNPMTSTEKAEKLIELAGGTRQILSKSNDAFDKAELQWALELVSAVLKLNPQHSAAIKLRLKILTKMAEAQTSANGRNYLLTVAMEDQGLVDNKFKPSKMIMRIPMHQLFSGMATRVQPEKCGDVDTITAFHFTDIGEVFIGHLRNGIFHVKKSSEEKLKRMGDSDSERAPDLTLTVSSIEWRRILGKVQNPVMSYLSGNLVIEGGMWNLIQFFRCFDREHQ